ncbi:MAG: AIPR family protein, partial [Armatimonadia bacterium]
THEAAIIEHLFEAIMQKGEECALPFDQAFSRVAVEWLGYEREDDDPGFVDGAGDRGIDFWSATEQSIDILQCKTHDPASTSAPDLGAFDADGVKDLGRAYSLLFSDAATADIPERLERLLQVWDDLVVTTAQRDPDDREPIQVMLTLVVLGRDLTAPAASELETLGGSVRQTTEVRGAPVEVRVSFVTVSDLISSRWRADNREWVDTAGRRRNTVDLVPEDGHFLGDSKGCVFYCRAIDLVTAFQQFGYQIFEPNVRCNIKTSKVNEAIKNSVQHDRSRHLFKFLNNGLTVVCKGYQNPNANRPAFRVTEPGVVNGLQTVVALHKAYSKLSDIEKSDFDGNCYVLVRLIKAGAAGDVNAIVRATNTQNPMEPRNLRSNSPEQELYERLFAQLGWFYERKDGAWDAFKNDPARWRSLPNCRPAQFSYTAGGGRPRERRADNEVLAQAWLSFMGMSHQAVHQKRYLFDTDKWYDLIFRQRTTRHAAEHGYPSEIPEEDRVREGPTHSMMLAAYLTRSFAFEAAPSVKENRDAACQRLNLDQKSTSREDLEKQLSQDDSYLAGQVLNGMSFVFTEAFGYMLYASLGARIHEAGPKLLRNGTMTELTTKVDFDQAVQAVRAEQYAANDVLAVSWAVFTQVINEMVASNWRYEYLAARSRTQFNHSPATRLRIKQALDDAHRLTLRQQPLRPWASGIKPGEGILGLFADALS